MNKDVKKLKKDVKKLKKELHETVAKKGINSKEALDISMKLDRCIEIVQKKIYLEYISRQ